MTKICKNLEKMILFSYKLVIMDKFRMKKIIEMMDTCLQPWYFSGFIVYKDRVLFYILDIF